MQYIIWIIISFYFRYYYCVRQTVIYCIKFNDTLLEVCDNEERSAHAFDCELANFHEQP